jgi:hypothetical protein
MTDLTDKDYDELKLITKSFFKGHDISPIKMTLLNGSLSGAIDKIVAELMGLDWINTNGFARRPEKPALLREILIFCFSIYNCSSDLRTFIDLNNELKVFDRFTEIDESLTKVDMSLRGYFFEFTRVFGWGDIRTAMAAFQTKIKRIDMKGFEERGNRCLPPVRVPAAPRRPTAVRQQSQAVAVTKPAVSQTTVMKTIGEQCPVNSVLREYIIKFISGPMTEDQIYHSISHSYKSALLVAQSVERLFSGEFDWMVDEVLKNRSLEERFLERVAGLGLALEGLTFFLSVDISLKDKVNNIAEYISYRSITPKEYELWRYNDGIEDERKRLMQRNMTADLAINVVCQNGGGKGMRKQGTCYVKLAEVTSIFTERNTSVASVYEKTVFPRFVIYSEGGWTYSQEGLDSTARINGEGSFEMELSDSIRHIPIPSNQDIEEIISLKDSKIAEILKKRESKTLTFGEAQKTLPWSSKTVPWTEEEEFTYLILDGTSDVERTFRGILSERDEEILNQARMRERYMLPLKLDSPDLSATCDSIFIRERSPAGKSFEPLITPTLITGVSSDAAMNSMTGGKPSPACKTARRTTLHSYQSELFYKLCKFDKFLESDYSKCYTFTSGSDDPIFSDQETGDRYTISCRRDFSGTVRYYLSDGEDTQVPECLHSSIKINLSLVNPTIFCKSKPDDHVKGMKTLTSQYYTIAMNGAADIKSLQESIKVGILQTYQKLTHGRLTVTFPEPVLTQAKNKEGNLVFKNTSEGKIPIMNTSHFVSVEFPDEDDAVTAAVFKRNILSEGYSETASMIAPKYQGSKANLTWIPSTKDRLAYSLNFGFYDKDYIRSSKKAQDKAVKKAEDKNFLGNIFGCNVCQSKDVQDIVGVDEQIKNGTFFGYDDHICYYCMRLINETIKRKEAVVEDYDDKKDGLKTSFTAKIEGPKTKEDIKVYQLSTRVEVKIRDEPEEISRCGMASLKAKEVVEGAQISRDTLGSETKTRPEKSIFTENVWERRAEKARQTAPEVVVVQERPFGSMISTPPPPAYQTPTLRSKSPTSTARVFKKPEAKVSMPLGMKIYKIRNMGKKWSEVEPRGSKTPERDPPPPYTHADLPPPYRKFIEDEAEPEELEQPPSQSEEERRRLWFYYFADVGNPFIMFRQDL